MTNTFKDGTFSIKVTFLHQKECKIDHGEIPARADIFRISD
jgi:hypothetical protein